MKKLLFAGLITMSLLAACSAPPASNGSGASGGATGLLPKDANTQLDLSALGKNAKLFDKNSKLDSKLTALSQTPISAQAVSQTNSKLGISGGFVTVDAVPSGTPEALLAQLQAAGLQNGSVYANMVSGRLPIASLSQAGGLSSLRSLLLSGHTTSAYSFPSQGLTVSEGDKAQASDVARQKYQVSGKGYKVGVLSDSFNCAVNYPKPEDRPITTAQQDVQNGDLPAEGVQVVQEDPDCSKGAPDEGRGMAQIVHDVAPSARLAFATAEGGQANFANNIEALAKNNSKVVVDDVGYLDEPMFQNGVIAQAVNTVAKSGTAYFSAAGNSGRQSYEGKFSPSGNTYAGCQLDNFTPGKGVNVFQGLTLAPGAQTQLVLQWDQPFASASRSGKGSASDMDLYLFDDQGNLLPTDPANDQYPVSTDNNVGADPVEIVQYSNYGKTPLHINLAMTLCNGAQPGLLKWVDYGNATDVQYATNSSTSYGHPNTTGGVGVGAARFYTTPAYGVNPPKMEPFTSAGGVPILFNDNGKRVAPQVLQDPLFSAPDGGNTSFFGQLTFGAGTPIPYSNDQFPNFFGTSAAAPHAAGVAALMLEATDKYGGKQTPAAIFKAMSQSAIDMNIPGYDYDTGYGLIQADRSIAAIIKRAPK